MSWHQAEFPVAPWDSPGLPPRTLADRCSTHPWVGEGTAACAYRDDDPARCPHCHMTVARGCDPLSCTREKKLRKELEKAAANE